MKLRDYLKEDYFEVAVVHGSTSSANTETHIFSDAKNKKDACTIAKQMAWDDYHVFQMNHGCRCANTATKEGTCEILFSYMSKKEKGKRP